MYNPLHYEGSGFLGLFLCYFVTIKENENRTHYSILYSTHDNIMYMFDQVKKLFELQKDYVKLLYRITLKIVDQKHTLLLLSKINEILPKYTPTLGIQ